MREAARRIAWAVVLSALAVMVWLLVSPVSEWVAAGRLEGIVRSARTSNVGLLSMWRVQLPGTALACVLFSLGLVRINRSGHPNWTSGGLLGAAAGGSASLVVFASPLPGLPVAVWGVTLYVTGLPVLWLLERMPERVQAVASFASLLAFWPVVVLWVLTALSILAGSVAGDLAWRRGGGAAEQRVEADEAG
jgi:hypothetical protein